MEPTVECWSAGWALDDSSSGLCGPTQSFSREGRKTCFISIPSQTRISEVPFLKPKGHVSL